MGLFFPSSLFLSAFFSPFIDYFQISLYFFPCFKAIRPDVVSLASSPRLDGDGRLETHFRHERPRNLRPFPVPRRRSFDVVDYGRIYVDSTA